METMTLAETVDLFVIANDENVAIPSRVLTWLRDYATLLRERESASARVPEGAKRLLLEAYDYGQFGSDFNQPQAVSVRRAICEICDWLAVAPMLASARVPDGWQLVPVVPTKEMLEAYRSHMPHHYFMDISIWKAILNAAPKPEKE